MDREEYEKKLRERQADHLEKVRKRQRQQERQQDSFVPCLHNGCSQCHGTGVKLDGTACVHMISCPCPKCTPYCMMACPKTPVEWQSETPVEWQSDETLYQNNYDLQTTNRRHSSISQSNTNVLSPWRCSKNSS